MWFVANFHLKNHKVTLMEISSLLEAEEAKIIKMETMVRSKVVENGNDLEQKVISLIQQKERLLGKMTNQRLKRKVDHEIALHHDLVEAYCPCCELKDYRKRSQCGYLLDIDQELVQETKSNSANYENNSYHQIHQFLILDVFYISHMLDILRNEE